MKCSLAVAHLQPFQNGQWPFRNGQVNYLAISEPYIAMSNFHFDLSVLFLYAACNIPQRTYFCLVLCTMMQTLCDPILFFVLKI